MIGHDASKSLKVVPIVAMSDARYQQYEQGGMPWPQTGSTHYHAQLGLPDKGRAIKGLVICNSCYQPSPEV